MVHLAGLTKMEDLDLEGCHGVSAEGLTHLAGMTSLHALHLNDSGVDDAAMDVLAGMKSLRSISIGRTRVTDEAVARLQQALPECEISR